MGKKVRKIILIGIVLSFITLNGYSNDKKYYQGPNYNDPAKPNYIKGTRTDMGEEQMNQTKDRIGREEYNKKLKERDEYLMKHKDEFADVANTYENTKSRAGILFIPSVIDKSRNTDKVLDQAPKVPANTSEAYNQWQKNIISQDKEGKSKSSNVGSVRK